MRPLRALFLVAAFALFALLPRDAQAKFFFGDQQYIKFLQDVPLKGPNGEALYLGHMQRTKYFIAGLYVTDEGYVLGIKGNRDRFFRMPSAAQIAQFQKDGMLPKPFPNYRLGMADYLVGYSLWILLVVIVGWGAFSNMRKRQEAAESAWTTRLPGAAP